MTDVSRTLTRHEIDVYQKLTRYDQCVNTLTRHGWCIQDTTDVYWT